MDMISAFTLNLRLIKPDMSVKDKSLSELDNIKKEKMKPDFLKHDPNHYCRWFEVKHFLCCLYVSYSHKIKLDFGQCIQHTPYRNLPDYFLQTHNFT